LKIPRTNWSAVDPIKVLSRVALETHGECAPWKRDRDWVLNYKCSNRSAHDIDKDIVNNYLEFGRYANTGVRDPLEVEYEALLKILSNHHSKVLWPLEDPTGKSDEEKYLRNSAAAAQDAWERTLMYFVKTAIEWIKHENNAPAPFGIVIVGTGALNFRANSALARHLNFELFVPYAPTDAGLGAGALCMAAQIAKDRPAHLGFAGPLLFDSEQVQHLAASRGGIAFDTSLTECEMAERQSRNNFSTCNTTSKSKASLPFSLLATIAEALAHGKVIAVARGRAEHGPRSHGHRSIFANPYSASAIARLRQLEENLRSPSIILAVLNTTSVFELHDQWQSPYDVEIIHPLLDSFAAHLLEDFEAFVPGPPILAMTPFSTTRGGPMLNTAKDALSYFCAEANLDALVIEDIFFFDKQRTC